jgi:hypothetical protein
VVSSPCSTQVKELANKSSGLAVAWRHLGLDGWYH